MKNTVFVLVAAMDPYGCPRAWGQASLFSDAMTRCHLELERYRTAKREVNDPLADDEFTFYVRVGDDWVTLAEYEKDYR